MTGESKYPECERLQAVKEKSQAIGEFINWLHEEKGILLAEYHTHDETCNGGNGCGIYSAQPIPWRYNIERLLAEYFSIDLDKVQAEKEAILENLRRKDG